MTCGPGQEPITKTELAIVRGLEKILSPLIVLAIAGLIAFSMQISETMAQLTAEHQKYSSQDNKIERSIAELDLKQDQLLVQQHELEKDVAKIGTHQEHFKAEIIDLKEQNTEILRILRSQIR